MVIFGSDRHGNICKLEPSDTVNCSKANKNICKVLGELIDKVRNIKVSIVLEISQELTLGIDFWNEEDIIPDLHANDW